MTAQRFDWQHDGRTYGLHYDSVGAGPPILMLPAFSTVCTREEMMPLASCLPGHRCVLMDWPGFGNAPQFMLRQTPGLHLQFLQDFIAAVLPAGTPLVAAGHAAGYALLLARHRPHLVSRIGLVAPTWRGPLPTMMNGASPWQQRLRRLIDAPLAGSALYAANTATPVLRLMYRRHVYADASRLTPDFLATKARIARRRNGRFGSGAFVTGALDPVESREAFAALLSPPAVPTRIVYGNDTPPRSRAEMQAMVEMPGIESQLLSSGSLAVHEEFPAATAAALREFLATPAPHG